MTKSLPECYTYNIVYSVHVLITDSVLFFSIEGVYGALLGSQKGRSVEVCNSFELVVTTVDGRAVLDKEYFTEKEEQCELTRTLSHLLFEN